MRGGGGRGSRQLGAGGGGVGVAVLLGRLLRSGRSLAPLFPPGCGLGGAVELPGHMVLLGRDQLLGDLSDPKALESHTHKHWLTRAEARVHGHQRLPAEV